MKLTIDWRQQIDNNLELLYRPSLNSNEVLMMLNLQRSCTPQDLLQLWVVRSAYLEWLPLPFTFLLSL
jgi:hypothetical protein